MAFKDVIISKGDTVSKTYFVTRKSTGQPVNISAWAIWVAVKEKVTDTTYKIAPFLATLLTNGEDGGYVVEYINSATNQDPFQGRFEHKRVVSGKDFTLTPLKPKVGVFFEIREDIIDDT